MGTLSFRARCRRGKPHSSPRGPALVHLLGPASTLARHVVERTPGRARASSRMASGAAMIRVDSGAKNALQTLLQHALDVAKSDSVDSLIAHLPKILPDAGKSSLSSVIHSLLRHAGYSWDSNRVWLTASPHEKSERRATAGPTTSRATAPRVAMGNWRPLRMCRLIGPHWAWAPRQRPCPNGRGGAAPR